MKSLIIGLHITAAAAAAVAAAELSFFTYLRQSSIQVHFYSYLGELPDSGQVEHKVPSFETLNTVFPLKIQYTIVTLSEQLMFMNDDS